MKKEKKYNLLITFIIMFLAYVVLSWIIPTGSVGAQQFTAGKTAPVGLFGLIYYPVIAFGSFFQYGLLVLAVGALYGVMAKTGVYGNLVSKVADKFAKKEKLCLILTVVILALLSSIVGIPTALFVLLPFVIAVLTKLGFNNVTVLAATFGSVLVGRIGSIIGSDIAGMTTILFQTKMTEWIAFKIILFVLVTALFVLFVISKKDLITKTKKVAAKKETKASAKTKTVKKVEKVQEKEVPAKKEILFLEEDVKSKKSSASLVIILIVMMLLAFVSMYDLSSIFKVSFFNDLYDQLMNIKIGDFAIFKNILNITGAFGTWNIYELIVLLIITSIAIGWVYSLSFDDYVDGFKTGVKKMLKPAFYVTIANILFTMMLVNNQNTIVTYVVNSILGLSKKFNVLGVAGSSIFASLFFNHFDYMLNTLGTVLSVQTFANGTQYFSIVAFVAQGLFGIIMMLLPTSMLLASGLSILDVKVKDWFKYIWLYLVEIFVIVMVLGFIVTLLV